MTVRREAEFQGEGPRFVEVRAFAESFAAAAGLGRNTAQRLVLVLEELFTNTATHGYPPGPPGPVWIALDDGRPGALEVRYEDAAPPFDPFRDPPAEASRDAPPVEERPPGGLGIPLVRGLSDSAEYARRAGRNRITVVLPRERAPRPAGPPG
jgi:serine/threonine-protein kinase RsbW